MSNFNGIIIEKGRQAKNYWKDLWLFRELFYILSLRDIKVRYKQTVLGFLWSVMRPLLTAVVFTFVFQDVANLTSSMNCPYFLMVYAGVLPWQFFANSLSEASNSLVGNANLITKVYFPRLIIPASAVITGFVDFMISFGILLLMMFWYSYFPDWKVIALPAFILLTFLCSFGVGLFLTALNVKYRDFRYIIPFIVQFGLYITPVGYSSRLVHGSLEWLFALNPMAGIIEGFRWCLLNEPLKISHLFISCIVSLFSVIFGVYYFRKTEKSFADNI